MAMDALARLRDAPGSAAILLDVDGTLAPIVERPEDSAVPETTREVLRDLVGRYALVGVVTGRPGEVARALVRVDGIEVAGIHGLELAPEADAWRERLRAFAATVDRPVEDKGLTVSFHYRTDPDPERSRVALEEVAARAGAEGLRARWGRMVLEVLPPIDADKGTAVEELLRRAGLGRALFAGDDTTDLDAFGAVERLELGVKVAVDSAEAPPDLLSRADLVVAGTAGLVDLLRTL
jgi:trehalose 6-phosphate phosphatase